MKHKLNTATGWTIALLFTFLTSVKIPFIFFASFLLLLARGIKMFIDFTDDNEKVNPEMPKEKMWKLIILRFIIQMIPVIYTGICFFLFFYRKEVWVHIFNP